LRGKATKVATANLKNHGAPTAAHAKLTHERVSGWWSLLTCCVLSRPPHFPSQEQQKPSEFVWIDDSNNSNLFRVA
jgi:hypothetical protein